MCRGSSGDEVIDTMLSLQQLSQGAFYSTTAAAAGAFFLETQRKAVVLSLLFRKSDFKR